jgi:hypothetical protein
LVLLLLIEAVPIIAAHLLPPNSAKHVPSVLYPTLLYAACVLAGYDLRTRWALVVTPLLAWGSMLVYFALTGNFNVWADLREDPLMVAVFVLVPSIPVVVSSNDRPGARPPQ